MTDTTIAVSNDVKERLREMQREGETFNGTLSRLMENYSVSGERWTEDEIRRMARDEAEEIVQQYAGH